MGYLLAQFWLWLALALMIGLAIGWFTRRVSSSAFWRGLWPWGLVLSIGGLASAFRVLPGAAGFWLDLGMLMVASYFIGCLIGHLLRPPQQEGRQVEATPFAKLAEAASSAPPVMPAAPPNEIAVEPAASSAAPALPDAPEEAITGLSAPRGGKADDLTRIYGIDAETSAKLNRLGLYHFDQIAALTPGQQRWLFARLGFAGRFPSWWWRWRFDAESIVAGQKPVASKAAPSTDDAAHDGTKPAVFTAPQGAPDDLKRILGIGPRNEALLHALGILHFSQIASWTAEEVKWVGSYLAFPGRIDREDWQGQARAFMKDA